MGGRHEGMKEGEKRGERWGRGGKGRVEDRKFFKNLLKDFFV